MDEFDVCMTAINHMILRFLFLFRICCGQDCIGIGACSQIFLVLLHNVGLRLFENFFVG